MGQINGTTILVYSNGVAIAAQRGGSISIDQNLPSASNKGSGGWADHINGERSATVDFDALYSTTGLSADALIALIINRTPLEIIWYGSTASSYHYRGQADPTGVTIDAPTEDAVSISGSFRIKGALYQCASGTSGLVAGVDNSDSDVYRSLDRGVSYAVVEAGTALSACCDVLGRYYFYLTATKIVKWDYDDGSSSEEQSITAVAGDKIRCSYTGQYVLAFEATALYYSSDYGDNFTSKATATVVDCDVASGGVYQVYCTSAQIYRSINSGSTFASLVYPAAVTLLGCAVNDNGDVLIIDSDNNAYFYLQGTGWSAADALGATPTDVCMNDTYGLVATNTDLQKFTKSGEGLSVLSTDAFTLVTTDKNGNTAFATDGTTVYIYDGTTLTSQGAKDLKDIYTP